jgi:carbonic anhydrase/acetyltransferase-like protein (isoleucine patch superfamily)
MIQKFKNYKPEINADCFIAGNADIVGRVKIEADASIWFGAVLRGDLNNIHIGKGSNIQDNCTIHVDEGGCNAIVGEYSTIGHNAILHGCKIGNCSLVGMGSIVLEGAVIGDETMIGAGSLITSNKIIPSGVLCMGSPAKVIRELTDEEKKALRETAEGYIVLAKEYKEIQGFKSKDNKDV